MPRDIPNTNPACPDDIRAAGWVVAVHNDYRLGGRLHTFWLFTKDDPKDRPEPGEGRFAKGEGEGDAAALNSVRLMIGLPILPPIEDEFRATYCDGPHTPPNCPHCVRLDGSPAYPSAWGSRARFAVVEGDDAVEVVAGNALAHMIERVGGEWSTRECVRAYLYLADRLRDPACDFASATIDFASFADRYISFGADPVERDIEVGLAQAFARIGRKWTADERRRVCEHLATVLVSAADAERSRNPVAVATSVGPAETPFLPVVREDMSPVAWRAASKLANVIGTEVQDLTSADAVAVYEHLVHAMTEAARLERSGMTGAKA